VNEESRARYPDADGYVERDGVRVRWERYGTTGPAVLLLPTWELSHSRAWKAQIPYLSRHFQVVTFDPRGNGRSARPTDASAYDRREIARDAVAILDLLGIERAAVVAWCTGVGVLLASDYPDRVSALVEVASDLPLTPDPAEQQEPLFDADLPAHEGWAKWNRHYWQQDWAGFAEFFFTQAFPEPHSTKQTEDAVGWALEADPHVIALGLTADWPDRAETIDICGRIRCPVLVIQGTEDHVAGPARGPAVAAAIPGARLLTFEGSGHAPQLRDPVRFNLELRDWLGARPPARRTWTRARSRPKRVLYISSPIGLGHARRDVAIARELRQQVPGLQIDWLAQDPVTRVLADSGEQVHPASVQLASEVRHFESESAEHDLHAFQAVRRMDELMVANFMLFQEVAEAGCYDLWIADEGWDVDYFLHENPELKTAAYCWLTDFVGWLPMPDGGAREAFLTADYNAEMVEQIARFPRVRDRALFVGEPSDVIGGTFGPDLPGIREWTEQNYSFPGYITGFEPVTAAERGPLRRELGYADHEQVCIVTVGGTGVGADLLRRVAAAYPLAKSRVPGLRMIVVAGPRIDPALLPVTGGLEVRAYVPDLYRHLAACDLAIVQGGLTTAMELTASQRPFLYFPLRHHFEQNHHVRHRLERHGAGQRMDYATATPEVIADAIAAEIGGEVSYRPVATGGAARAAALIAELL
jgi:pimeloyl-ACP methyl ester carboxylesterase/predicted glycosyltransferase